MKAWYFRISGYARPQLRALWLVLLLILASAGLEALKPWPLKLLLDSVFAGKPLPQPVAWVGVLPGGAGATGRIFYLTLATVFIFLAVAITRMAQSYVQAGASTRMVYQLSADLFEHVQRLSLRFHTRNKIGDLLQRVVNDSGCVRELVMNVLLPLLTSVASLAAMFAVMLRLDAVLTWIALAVAPPLLLMIKIFGGPMEERSYEQSELQGKMMGAAEETLTAIPIVQAFTREPHEDRRFGELTERTGRAYVRSTASQLWFKIATSSVTALGTAAIMLFGGLHVLDKRLSIGTLLVFMSYLGSLYSPMETITYLSSGWATAAAGARRVLQIMNVREEVVDQPGAIDIPTEPKPAAPRIAFEDVSFGYEPGHAVLRNVSLEIRSGETVALVGATGSGKSTLVSLILRLFDPLSGRITLDERDLRHVRLASLRSQIAVVLQEPYLFPVSVAENIAHGRASATREEIVEAAVAAQADGFIRRLPQGYDTVIGERGATLSGGERQRIAIARAFVKNAPVLLLDEPTAAMDAQTEADLVDALERLMQGRTSIIVAHRLSVIRNASRIFVLEDGRLVESGPEAELLAKKGLYSQLHGLQMSGAPLAKQV